MLISYFRLQRNVKENLFQLYVTLNISNLQVHEWMKKHISVHPLFTPLSCEELSNDPCVSLLTSSTEEAAKVTRNGGKHYIACFKRIDDEYVQD